MTLLINTTHHSPADIAGVLHGVAEGVERNALALDQECSIYLWASTGACLGTVRVTR